MSMKKLLSAVLSTAMIFCLVFPAWAQPDNDTCPFAVSTPTFPDAYILIEDDDNEIRALNDDEYEDSITVTVFVSERWDTINGERVVVESRLLSKEEVDEIGIENLGAVTRAGLKSEETYGKLTLRIGGTCQVTGQKSIVNVSARATWDGESLMGENGPAKGKDYMGYVWGGNFSVANARTKATSSLGKDVTMTQDKVFPGAGVVWNFDEFIPRASGNELNDYAKYIDADLSLQKNSMTGNGNVTDVVCQYIHTYQTVKGSIALSSSGLSFSLSETPAQWPISVVYSNARY